MSEAAAVRRLRRRTGFAAVGSDAPESDLATAAEHIFAERSTDHGVADTPPPRFAALDRPDKSDADGRKAYAQQVKKQSEQLTLWWLDRMVAADNPWPEKRTLLWHGHWATSIHKVKSAAAMLAQNETQRRLGGGDFRTLARAMVQDPALMIWLDASGNIASAPNENLAREFMELFTLGVGHYSETDVRQAARALTGWRIRRRLNPPKAAFVRNQHAEGTQTILGHTADFSATDLVDLLVAQPASVRYLATRHWGWLVGAAPPSAASLDRIVAAWGAQRSLTAFYRAIVTDPAFVDPANVVVKAPIDYVVGLLRAARLRPSTMEPKQQRAVLVGLRGLGQTPFDPPSVGGWPTGGAWLTTGAAQARLTLGLAVARAMDLTELKKASTRARPDALAARLGLDGWSERTRSVLVAASDPVQAVALAAVAPEYVVS